MIEMAKELGYGGYEDDSNQGMDEDLNPNDFEVFDEESSPDNAEMSQEELSPEDFEKNETFYKLINKINTAKKTLELKKKEDKKKMLLKLKQKLNKFKSKNFQPGKDKSKFKDKKKKVPKPKKVEAASFCSSSNQKMKTSGKDCRANEDKDSPVCAARKKMNCRGKNAEKGSAIQKSEKLKKFLEKKRKK